MPQSNSIAIYIISAVDYRILVFFEQIENVSVQIVDVHRWYFLFYFFKFKQTSAFCARKIPLIFTPLRIQKQKNKKGTKDKFEYRIVKINIL